MFAKYHYLSGEHNNAAKAYVATVNGEMCAFISIQHFPHGTAKNIKRVHRLVTIPDYQGIGVGKLILNEVGKIYRAQRFRYRITTSHPKLIRSLNKDPLWVTCRTGRMGRTGRTGRTDLDRTLSRNRITASFEMK